MFAITTSPTWFTKTDDFKKVGKKIQKQRSSEVIESRIRLVTSLVTNSDVSRKSSRSIRIFSRKLRLKPKPNLNRSIFTKSDPHGKSN